MSFASKSRTVLSILMLSFLSILFINSCGGDNPTEPLPVETFSVVSISPANLATGIPVTTPVVVTFDADVDGSTISTASFQVSGVTGTVSTSGTTATFTPTDEMNVGTTYTVTLASNITNSSGTALNNIYTSSFSCLMAQGVPSASAGADLFYNVDELVSLDGSLSSEPGGLALTYNWTQISGPSAGTITTDATPELTAIADVTTLEFELTVTSQGGTSSPDTVMVMICEDKDNMFFVSPNGDNANGGTKEAPMLTIQAAIDASNTAGLFGDVYLAEGTYTESLTLGNGVSLYGGFDADKWTRSESPALTIIQGGQRAIYGNAATYLTIDGLTIESAAGNASELSSIGIGFESCANVTLTNNIITAGAGYTGANGINGINGPNGQEGGDGTIDTPGSGGSTGGFHGGDGGLIRISILQEATDGEVGEGPLGGDGGLHSQPDAWILFVYTAAEAGSNGGDGVDGADGAGAQQFGILSNGGYSTAGGSNGTYGVMACGGGGGGGGINVTILASTPGAGGGAGGGGATPGRGGEGGGSSFGVILTGICDVVINSCTITTQDGGNGGNGGNSATGGNGGSGGIATYGGLIFNPGGNGGNGGIGGDAGAGGGGSGGYSVGIIHSSTSTLSHLNNLINTGSGGNAGLGENGNNGQGGMASGIAEII